MSEEHKVKPNNNDQQCNQGGKGYENAYGQPSYLPANYDCNKTYTDSFYDENESSGAGSFLVGALVGGVIGAAAALFLAPKTGSEMRGDLTIQAAQLKGKSIEISSVAKGKATELTSVAKEKTGELSKTIQEQSGQLVDKVKSMKSKTSIPMDDGTASSEGEESIDFIDTPKSKIEHAVEVVEDNLTTTAEAIKKAVVGKLGNIEDATVDNSDVSSVSSKNLGKE